MITSAYTLCATDNAAVVALGGSAFFTLTASPALDYDPAFQCRIVNADAARGKTIAIDGYAPFILWPGQVLDLFAVGGAWQKTDPGRWRSAGVTVYVDHANGNDANDGLAAGSGAFQTIQAAFNCVTANVDAGQGANGVKIQLANETFYENVLVHGPIPFQLTICGNPANPSAVNWCSVPGTPSGSFCINAHDKIIVVVDGVTFWGGDVNHCAIGASQFGFVGFANTVFQNFSGPASAHIRIGALGCANWERGTYTISGPAISHLEVGGPSWFYCFAPTVNLTRTAMPFSQFISASGSGAAVLFSGTVATGIGAGAATNGAQWVLTGNATLTQGGFMVPGALPGTRATGAQVL